ncbi:MAG: hypothetical protein HUU57_11480 [Bdellovibrio sp.]|nr:hypothetical protein [Bdellovibrio sp.]
MMHPFHWALLALSLSACASTAPQGLPSLSYAADEIQLKNREVSSDSDHKNENKSYLSLDLPYAPFEKIRVNLEKQLHLNLKNRGEAHVTVITPPEFKKLQHKLSMKEIHRLAEKMGLEQSSYTPVCVGKSALPQEGHTMATYYVVVDAENLFNIRKAVYELFVKKGGKDSDFSPEKFYPHVTLGFTHRDLHFEDGITKDASSCIYTLRPESQK